MLGAGLVQRNVGVAAGTAASRVTGLARVVMIGIVLGGDELADAYVSSNNAPNAVYELLVGGVLSAGLVPLLTDLRAKGDRRSTNSVLTVGAVLVLALTIVAIVCAPLIFRVLSLNADRSIDVDQFRSAGTMLTRILLIQIAFYGVIALTSALLHANRRFLAAAWSPVLANLVTVGAFAALLIARPSQGWSIDDIASGSMLRLVLGFGATIGIAVSAVVLIGAARRLDHRFEWSFRPRDPAVRRLMSLSTWTFGYVAVNQIALVIVQNLTEPGSGGRFAYSQAYTFFVLPHGLLAVSIATTLSPELAEAFSKRSEREFSRVLGLGMRFTMLLTVPSAVGIFALRRPIVGLFLEHGALSSEQVALVADTLGAFALGLPAFSLYLFVLRGFYARLDTRTPFLINACECALNVVVGVVLVQRFGVPGLAASFSVAYAIAAIVAGVILVRRTDAFDRRAIAATVGRIAVAGGALAVSLWLLGSILDATVGVAAGLRVAVGIGVGVVVYLGVLRATRDPDLRDLMRVVARRRGEPT